MPPPHSPAALPVSTPSGSPFPAPASADPPPDAASAAPDGAQPTWAEMRLGLAAAPAPGGPHAPPAVAADGAHHPTGAGVRQQGVAEGALRREEQLLDRVTRRVHGAPRPA